MKNLIEILGSTQLLLGINFDPDLLFEEKLTDELRGFMVLLRVIEEHLPHMELEGKRFGRPRYSDLPIFRACIAKHCFHIDRNNQLRQRLLSDSNLRRICGMNKIPSEATFSRRLTDFSKRCLPDIILARLIKQYHEDRMVCVIARDSTAIAARERPENKKKEIEPVKNKRGRPRKDEIREPKVEKRLHRQIRQPSAKSLKELNKDCAWGCKLNSQGNPQYWKGYKLHLDVSGFGIPISACVTGANVHDSQVAIPLEKITERRITHLYTMADAAYDVPELRNYIKAKNRIAVIDYNKRRRVDAPQLGLLEREQFKARTVVERANAHLKDHFLPTAIFVKGYQKVSFVLLLGVLCLAATKLIQSFLLPESVAIV